MALDKLILSNFGGKAKNKLLNILPENAISILESPYYATDDISTLFGNKFNQFLILSLNCQSLNAKFDRINIFLETLQKQNVIFGAICLQETWLGEHTDLSLFQIDNYFRINQFKQCSEHGGLLIYLHNSYDFEIFNTYKSNY